MTRNILLLIITVILLSANASATGKILFYEVGAPGEYTIEGGYSKFAEELKNKGYEVASITRGDLTKSALEPYSILVLPGLGKSLSTDEISAIIEFVQKGRGLYLDGGGTTANQLTPLFGVTLDSGMLIDTTDQIPNMNDRNSFTLDRFNDQEGMSTLRYGVTKIGFYRGSGFKITSDKAKIIAQGNSDTYSDTGSFAPGSYPPIAVASLYSDGLVFITDDADPLTNKYLNDYNNKRFGLNIIEWLGLAGSGAVGNSTQELQMIVAELKLDRARLDLQVKQLTEEKNALMQQNSMLSGQVTDAQQQLADLQSGMIGPFNRMNWAIIVLGVCIFLAAIILSKRKGVATTAKTTVRDEEILSELGYELESGGREKPQPKLNEKDLESELDNIKL